MNQFGGEDITCLNLLGVTFLALIIGIMIGIMIGSNNLIITPIETMVNRTEVKLYTWTSCSACHRFLNSNVWQDLTTQNIGVKFDHYNTEDPSSDDQLPADVNSFPTIRLIRSSGSHIDYPSNMPRTVPDLVNWIGANK